MKNSLRTYKSVVDGTGTKSAASKKAKTAKDKYSFTVDSSFIVTSWSSSMEKLSHKMEEAVIGQKIDKVFPFLHDEVALVFSLGKRRRLKNYENSCFMGTSLRGDIQLVPLKDRIGKVKEVSVQLNNITGQCPLDKKLSDSEKMVAIGKIASSLAHGVRNPLNAIKGAVVYLREKYGHEATLLEFSTIINEEIDKLDSFISNFLSASRQELRFSTVNINGILKSILAMVKPRTDMQKIKLLHRFAVLPLIAADSFQIEQALFNMITNAVEAMPDGGAMNIKTSMRWESNDDYVLIEISDTGKGIPEGALNRLGGLSSESEKSDRGFGIFLSREVIKSHNGKLLWESVRDRGTTFKIFLPVKQSGN
jgi:two-component system nitrogen regulation sensor histidine kinase GlnL